MSKNLCGGCQACCQVYLVEEPTVYSAAGNLCVFADSKNSCCKIYEDRLRVCAEYRCHWLKSANREDSQRPDRSGVVQVFQYISCYQTGRSIPVMRFWELKKGALEWPRVLAARHKFMESSFLSTVWTRRKFDHTPRFEDVVYYKEGSLEEVEINRLEEKIIKPVIFVAV